MNMQTSFSQASQQHQQSSGEENILSSPRRVLLIVLDGAGVGALPDASEYGDQGASTLPHVSQNVGGLKIPVLQKLGLGNVVSLEGVTPAFPPHAAYGRMAMKSEGKDTTTGHWEISGIILPSPFPLYPHGFPHEVTEAFSKAIGRGILGNKAASGTEIINELGEEHLQTGKPIVYTSADSVFQIAAHEDIVPLDILYNWCSKAREILTGKHAVSRVIARPFTGHPGNFKRTPRRRDYALPPPNPTMLDLMSADGIEVTMVGKIRDIFDGRGITRYIPVEGDNEAVEQGIWEALETAHEGLIWANFNDFDTLYGHRNDPAGFAAALERVDHFLGKLLRYISGKPDMLIITADHGCDPTYPGTDHTREYVPLLVYFGDSPVGGENAGEGSCCFSGTGGIYLGARESMSDIGATIMDYLGAENPGDISGHSFLKVVRP